MLNQLTHKQSTSLLDPTPISSIFCGHSSLLESLSSVTKYSKADSFNPLSLISTSNVEELQKLEVSNWNNENSLISTDSSLSTFWINTRILAGTLRADTFNVSPYDRRVVISGNGNVDFGQGWRDLLNLSHISYTQVSLNFANDQGGVVFNPGNGNRVFDAINFGTGQQILFEGIESIQFAEGIIDLTIQPNDPLFGQQWNLHMMGVHTAWRFTTGSADVMIGVQDTGLSVDFNGSIHPDLHDTIWLSNQVIDDTLSNHGTSVQGIISARSNNGFGMSGINWNSQTFNIDVLGDEFGDLSIANATQSMIAQAGSNGKRLVINMSLGTLNSFGINCDRQLEQIVKNNPDVLFVIAAGNQGHLGIEGISSPAFLARSYSNVIAVGAAWGAQDYYGYPTVPGDRISYQNWWGSQYGDGLTLMGPAEVIAPLLKLTMYGTYQFDYSNLFNGTSAATPNVAGVASLVLSANYNLSAAQVREILSQTAVDVGYKGYDKLTGYGFVNADAAVRRAMAIGRGYA
ncbi:S8 family serine peptidase [Alkalinema pantanalense CENA528]|uniref:S8 family serine peptidase n=1 Tax=Alkalinema pantanalense TaxID=1620705 RepID=UPI003D6F80C7